ncbi:MAG TPA: Wzz/FepE/Etk N-terminal domain-containing protein [Geobacteraceae bacterium]|nr:Wzz/FepE/Etk N-terminal domain-containing protein [Geobacteraceae bacterium]
MGQEVKTIQDFLAILKRRKRSIIITAAAVFIISAIVAFAWPPVFRSTATILVEEPEVPRDYVNATVTSYVEQRLQTINQRIMGTTQLIEIIKKFNLYEDLKKSWTTEEIIEKMRKDIKLSNITADVIDPRTGQPRPATIAFTLSYQGKNPVVVQQVANELSSLYLEENLKDREKSSEGTSTFLEEEMKSVKAKLEESEAKIAAFKQKNVNALPDIIQVNLQAIESLDREIISVNYQLRSLREREGNLQTELATIPTDAASQDKARLNELRVRLNELKTHYTDEHPDVIKTKAELAELVKQLRASGRDTADNKPDNPAYVTMASQLSGVQSEIESAKRQLDALNRKKGEYQRRIAASPGVEEGYKNILVERNDLQLKYDDLAKKYMEAKTAHGLEKEQKAERFTLIDAARLPEKPVFPNIPAILLIGLVLGMGSGAGVAALNEQSDQTARSPETLAWATSFPVLACIPEIVTWQDLARQKVMRRRTIIGAVLFLVVGIMIFHFFIMDLDVFWAKLMRRAAKL